MLTIGIALLFDVSSIPKGAPRDHNGVMAVVSPIRFTALLAGILGAIAVTGEYSTGMIRSTLTADPVRGRVLAAKATVLAVFLFVASLADLRRRRAPRVTPILGGQGHGAGLEHAVGDDRAVARRLPVDGGVRPDRRLLRLRAALGSGRDRRDRRAAVRAADRDRHVLAGRQELGMDPEGEQLPAALGRAYAILPTDNAAVDAPVAYLTLGLWVVAGMLGAWVVLRTRDA